MFDVTSTLSRIFLARYCTSYVNDRLVQKGCYNMKLKKARCTEGVGRRDVKCGRIKTHFPCSSSLMTSNTIFYLQAEHCVDEVQLAVFIYL